MSLALDRPQAAAFAGPAAASAVLAGAAYCQAHGALSGVHAPLAVSLWWSASGVLPLLAVAGVAARGAPRFHRRPVVGTALLALAFAFALALGEVAYAGVLALPDAWASAVFRALPAAAGLAAGAGLTLWTLGRRRPPPSEPAPPIPCDVALVRSAGNYLSVETDGRETLIRLPLHEAARRLAPRGFVQAHRTALVNIGRVACAQRQGGRLVLRLDDGRVVPVGRAYAAAVRSSLAARRSSQDV